MGRWCHARRDGGRPVAGRRRPARPAARAERGRDLDHDALDGWSGRQRRGVGRSARGRRGRSHEARGGPAGRIVLERSSVTVWTSSGPSSTPERVWSSRSSRPEATGRCARIAGSRPSCRRLTSPDWLDGCACCTSPGTRWPVEPIRFAVEHVVASRVLPGRASASTSRRGASSGTSGPRSSVLASRALARRRVRERGRGANRRGTVRRGVWIVKRGARGCSFDGIEHPALPTDVVDATGAGDALAAGWLLGGPELALLAAARCVAHAGSMPISGPTATLGCCGPALRLSPESRDRAARETRCRRPRDDPGRTRVPGARRRRCCTRQRASCSRGGRRPGDGGRPGRRLRIGLDADELQRFTPDARKLGPRDLAAARSRALSGRRRSEGRSPPPRCWDPGAGNRRARGGPPRVSRTARRLGRSRRAGADGCLIVCSGVKSLLDVAATVELLETWASPRSASVSTPCRSSTPPTADRRSRLAWRAPPRWPGCRRALGARWPRDRRRKSPNGEHRRRAVDRGGGDAAR